MSDKAVSGFSAREVRYLESLPAVAHVGRSQIRYEEGFKRECIRRYAAGESPVEIFRSAGLDPLLIGYKRIERCFARWKRTVRFDDDFVDDVVDGNTVETYVVDEDDRWPPRQGRVTSTGRARTQVSRVLQDGDFAISSGTSDVYWLIIMQQAKRIEALEHEISELRSKLDDGRD